MTTIFQKNSQLHKCDGINFQVISFVIWCKLVFFSLAPIHQTRTFIESKMNFGNHFAARALWSDFCVEKEISSRIKRFVCSRKRLNHLLIHY